MEGQQAEPKLSLDAPIPLSFPSLLRNPGVSSRYAHLYEPHFKATPPDTPRIPKKTRRDENGGRRWVRRKENAQFIDNPHVVAATRKDYLIEATPVKVTFPEPLPPYLSRSAKVPSRLAPELDAKSANAGRFSMSLKGMRRDLRKCGYRAEVLVGDIETEIMAWLDAGGAVVAPNLHEDVLQSPGRSLGNTHTVLEVSRTPLQLVWDTAGDPFARYVVHCCARFHNVVSYSKDVSGRRLTYMLRPNVTRPDHNAAIGLDTPPATDIDTSSQFASDSDFHSDLDSPSDLAESDHEREVPHLSTIIETSTPISSAFSDENWSVIGGSDMDGDESENGSGLLDSLASLTIHGQCPDRILGTISSTPASMRSRLEDRRQHLRSTSSPSRSPARRAARRPQSGLNVRTRPARTLYNLIYGS
ncbi:hypothetical protein E1B28_000759 [Marasmius oreades]|uniref:Uncharacterized protein n=1 Tax=Marasmius oreades TaxID=181124 RepID=A0A9P7V1Y4_9AGAR|nr:uncharacterized protein E1B28_000759 [Marasmius oreades]KAG7098856.1 hypothetical protein E1B28_000759 [Marasmius oreades]